MSLAKIEERRARRGDMLQRRIFVHILKDVKRPKLLDLVPAADAHGLLNRRCWDRRRVRRRGGVTGAGRDNGDRRRRPCPRRWRRQTRRVRLNHFEQRDVFWDFFGVLSDEDGFREIDSLGNLGNAPFRR
ncbi:hypothetical protein M2322_004691 [Rhodoblastus acidophilus]|nr:hypothetical protein [Rhodoblastus acidophilus]